MLRTRQSSSFSRGIVNPFLELPPMLPNLQLARATPAASLSLYTLQPSLYTLQLGSPPRSRALLAHDQRLVILNTVVVIVINVVQGPWVLVGALDSSQHGFIQVEFLAEPSFGERLC